MRKLLILLITISVGLLSEAQSAKSINFELGGPGLASFNFDTRFGPKEDGIGGRVGIGGFSLRADGDNVTVLFIPIGVNYLIGKDQRNYFELGAGVTPVIASSSFGHVLFGYRMQPKDGGFTFRAFVSPVFGEFGFIPYFGGVSFGYKFGSGKEKK